jgi:hypothetical protein
MVHFREILARLQKNDIDFIIVDGVAAVMHGASRVTLDVDVCVPLNHATSVKIITAFSDAHPRWRMRPDLPVIQPDNHNLKEIKNLYLQTDLGQIDIMGELPGVSTFPELWNRTTKMDLDGIPVHVLDLDTLIAAKRGAGRDKDRPAVRELEAIRERLGDGEESV